MMDYSNMMGNNGGLMMGAAWIVYLLFVILLILGIVALWKFIEKK